MSATKYETIRIYENYKNYIRIFVQNSYFVEINMNYRAERVQSLIQTELGKLLLREVEFPALVTITGVEVNKKLDIARVLLSVLPSSSEEKSLKIAEKVQGKLQYLLTKKINIKPMPKIQFEIDRGAENAAKVEKLLIDKHN